MAEQLVVVNFKVTPQEQKMIERHAKKEGMNVSDYIRTTLYLDMVTAGDLEAIRRTRPGVSGSSRPWRRGCCRWTHPC